MYWLLKALILHFNLSFTHAIFHKGPDNHLNILQRRMSMFGGKLGADSVIYSLNHYECVGHTEYKLAYWYLTTEWGAQWESACSCISNKVSFGWLHSSVKVTLLRSSKWLDTFQRDLIYMKVYLDLIYYIFYGNSMTIDGQNNMKSSLCMCVWKKKMKMVVIGQTFQTAAKTLLMHWIWPCKVWVSVCSVSDDGIKS